MAQHLTEAELPEDIVRIARAQVQAGRFANVEDVLRAGVRSIEEQAEDEAARDETIWAAFLARKPSDPRDLTFQEASLCLHSSDPEKRRVLREHLDVLFRDMDAGKGRTMDDAAFSTFLDGCLPKPTL